MNFPKHEVVEKIRQQYPKGCRVELDEMDDVQAPPIGTRGTVTIVDDIGNIVDPSQASDPTHTDLQSDKKNLLTISKGIF